MQRNSYGYPGRRGKKTKRNSKRFIIFVAFGVALVLLAGMGCAYLINRQYSGPSQELIHSGEVQSAPAKTAGLPYVVALDAGHGGADVGAEGIIQEVELTERTVAVLYELLAANESFTPVLCRAAGQGASIDERVAAADAQGAVLLLSIHGNSDPVYNSSGFECFPAPPGRSWHADSLRFGQLLAQEMGNAGASMRGANGVRYVYYKDGKNSSADKVIYESTDTTVHSDPSFGMVEKPDCPAVLAEQCFITNQQDYTAFGTEEGCRVAAQAYYSAILQYFGL